LPVVENREVVLFEVRHEAALRVGHGGDDRDDPGTRTKGGCLLRDHRGCGTHREREGEQGTHGSELNPTSPFGLRRGRLVCALRATSRQARVRPAGYVEAGFAAGFHPPSRANISAMRTTVILLFLLLATAVAEAGQGVLTGTVKDESGGVVSGASVVLRSGTDVVRQT